MKISHRDRSLYTITIHQIPPPLKQSIARARKMCGDNLQFLPTVTDLLRYSVLSSAAAAAANNNWIKNCRS